MEAAIAAGRLLALKDAAAVAREAVRIWAAGARRPGGFRVAISGGKTPEGFFRMLASLQDLPWPTTEIFWVDERHVPPDHAESNYHLARAALLDHVPIPKSNIHPMPTGSSDPKSDAQDYEVLLRRKFLGQSWPSFDLVLLGLGDDGHTASLFPSDPALQESLRWVLATRSPQGVRDRLTLTIPALNQASKKVFLVCGSGKAGILKAVLDPQASAPLPARLITGALFLADREAAPWASQA